MTKYSLGEEVTIPNSALGSCYGIGKIVGIWADKMAVDFKGHLGHYTISNHEIYRVSEIAGINIAIDPNVLEGEILVKYNG